MKKGVEKQLDRVRRICEQLPGTSERLSHSEPTFFVGKKVFLMFANYHHDDGHLAVWAPAPDGAQEMLIEAAPEKFFRPPYVGHRGWVGIELRKVRNTELEGLVRDAWRLIAPKKLLKEEREDGEGE